jgi:class 3 adenylate cyclase/predicted ATPase
MDVGGWLRSLGLDQYEATFRENAIEAAVLPSLTAADLKELGVGPLGHRRRLLNAIAALHAEASAKTPSADVNSGRSGPLLDTGERRQVTVMFSDLVGSTAMSVRMDPEDLREVISSYQKCVADTVRRFDGFVAKYMGDGVLIYFGYPKANEDDAERAVGAALELVAAVGVIACSVPLQTRIGIATGLVVVGDLIGSGVAQERGIVGETPNLAARLQGLADPNMVVIAEGTRRLIGNLFELEDFGLKNLKGIGGPVRCYAAFRANAVESRFEALHTTALTALVGRRLESEALLRLWSKAKAGEGQVVLIAGEAGIGKSRLTAALLAQLAVEPHARLRYFCSPQHTDSALYPIIGQMERAAGLAHDDTHLAKLNKLEAMLALTPSRDAALFAEMLSLKNDGRYPTLDLTPQQRRQETMKALTSHVARLAGRMPLLMILEDAHWVDPTSLEAFGRIVDRIKTLPVLLIVTFRPEFSAPWTGQSHVTSLSLNRLAEGEAAAIIAGLVGSKQMPADVVAEIIERTDGVPLFVEEMTKAILEAKSEGETRRTAAAVPSSALAVPSSLHATLMARLDRLGSAKGMAQIGAAIGREFSHALLAAVAMRNERSLCTALDQLMHAGLLFRQGVPPAAFYLFKHALVRDAAYGSLLREPRRSLHARIASAIEDTLPEEAQNRPELLAHHYSEAGMIERAAKLWGIAGQRSISRSALAEAAAQLSRAVSQIATLPETSALHREQIKYQIDLVTVLMHIKGYGAPETKAAVDRARLLIETAEGLGEPPEDPLLLFSVLYGAWVVNVAAFDGEAAGALATQFMALAEKQRMTGPLMLAHRMVGMTVMSTGDPVAARIHLDRALALYDPAEHRALATRFGTDARVAILEWRSRTLWLQGYPDAALKDVDESFRSAREIGQAATLMHALAHSIATLILCRHDTSASVRAGELVTLAEEKGSLYWKANGLIWQGCLSAMTGDAWDAIETLTTAVVAYRSTAATIYMPFVSLHLARAHAELGQFTDAWQHIDEAIAGAETSQEKWAEPEIHRTAGEIALMHSEAEEAKAEAHFERALMVARGQRAKSWELRAATSLARLWRDQGKRTEAYELLASIYEWFTEGFDTPDLKEAEVLLGELASSENN